MNQNQLEIRFDENSDFRIVLEKKKGLELPKITIKSKDKTFSVSSTETPNTISKQEYLEMKDTMKNAGIKALAMQTFFSGVDSKNRDEKFAEVMKGFKLKEGR